MRLSEVPVLSLRQHDLVYHPGGLPECLPFAQSGMLRSSGMTLSAVRSKTGQAPACCLPRSGPQLSNNFRGSIQTLPTRSIRLLTFVSSGQRVSLLGCWLGFARGRILTSWITATDFIKEAILKSQQLRV